jgi:hypothetical protein
VKVFPSHGHSNFESLTRLAFVIKGTIELDTGEVRGLFGGANHRFLQIPIFEINRKNSVYKTIPRLS